MLNFPAILNVSKVRGSHVFAIDTANTDMVFLFFEEGLYSPRLIFLGKFVNCVVVSRSTNPQ